MVDTVEGVQKAFYTALNGNLAGVPVYDHVPDGTPPPVVIIDQIQSLDWSTKDSPGEQHTVEVVTVVQTKSRKALRTIMSDVKDALVDQVISSTGVTISRPTFESSDEEALGDGLTHIGRQRFGVFAEPA